MAHNGFRIIEARRRQDAKQRDIEATIASENRAMSVAHFEQSTTQKIELRTMKGKMEAERRQKNVELHERRKKLANLYNAEMEQWQEDILSRVETKEERKARIMERAHALKDAREKEREQFVRECYDKRWRDACDDARTLDSQAMEMFMDQKRREQIEEKMHRKQAITAEESAFMDYINRYQAELDEKERLKQEGRSDASKDRSGALIEQIAFNKAQKKKYREETRKGDNEKIAEIRAALAREEEIQRSRLEEERKRQEAILAYNARYKTVVDERDRTQRKQDQYLLQYAMDKEAEAIAMENAKRNANKASASQYRKYLEEQMVKEAEDNSALDDIRRVEEEKVWHARDAALDARERARNELRKVVDEGRQEQIEYRRRQAVQEAEEDRRYVSQFMVDAREGIQKERDEERMRRDVNMANRGRLEEQIELRREREERERQQTYLEDKQMRYMEKLHMQKLQEQGGVVRTFRPLKQGQWYS